ncbi:sigma factor [Bacillus sp. Brlt_9]|uniref:sigma factor n=1 Tax=Bacillus sp. Brlt_9 TaxID=3110916 RepID=UPI003F7C06D8
MNPVINQEETNQLPITLSDNELLEMYKETFDVTLLRIMYSRNKENLSNLSEEMLIVLLQNSYENVKPVIYNLVKENNYESSDESLAIMAQEGDSIAKEVIALRYVEYVKKVVIALKKRGRYNRGDDDEDLIQSGYIGFFKAIRDFKIEKKRPFRIFVQHVIKRHIDSIISRSSNNKLRTLNDAFSYHSPVSNNDSENTFEQLLRSEEFQPEHHLVEIETFWEMWELLSETEKSVLWYYSEDYAYEEIGHFVFRDTHSTVDKQIKAVDNTMQRIKTKRIEFIEAMKKSK